MSPDELFGVVSLATNRIAAAYEGIELGKHFVVGIRVVVRSTAPLVYRCSNGVAVFAPVPLSGEEVLFMLLLFYGVQIIGGFAQCPPFGPRGRLETKSVFYDYALPKAILLHICCFWQLWAGLKYIGIS